MKWTLYKPLPLFFFVLIFLATLKTHRTYMGQGDEPQYIVTTESLLLDHDLDVSNNFRSPRLMVIDVIGRHVNHREGGRDLPHHPIGLPLLAMPVLSFAYHLYDWLPESIEHHSRDQSWIITKNCFSFAMMILAGCMSVLLFRFFSYLFPDRKWAWISALIVSLSPPLLSYGFLFFTELPSAFIITALLFRLMKEEDLGLADCFWIGYLPWIHFRNFLAAGFLLLFWLQKIYRDKKNILALPLWRPLIPLAMWTAILGINLLLWTGLSPEQSPFQLSNLATAIPALFLDRSFGLFIFSPWYALAPCGLLLLWRKNRPLAGYCLLLLIALLIPASGFYMWWGGWSPGPRFLVPGIPLLAIGIAAVIQETRKFPWGRRFLSVALSCSFFLSALYWQDPRLLWNPEKEGRNLFLSRWFGAFGRWMQRGFPNYFGPFPRPQWQGLFWIVFVFILNASLYMKLRHEERAPEI